MGDNLRVNNKQLYVKGDYNKKTKGKFIKNKGKKLYSSVTDYVTDMQYDFNNFIIEFNIIGLTAGVILGTVGNNTIKSIIDNIIMPLLSPLFGSKGNWEDKTVNIGNIELRLGKFVGDIIYFLFVFFITFGFLNYFFAKVIMGRDNVSNLSKKWKVGKSNGSSIHMV